jgi:hypothetical protein
MADEKPSGEAPQPSDRLKNLSPLQFRRTEPLRLPADPIESPWKRDRERRAAEVKEPAPGGSWRKVLGIGALGGAAVAGGLAAGGPLIQHVQIMPSAMDSVVNAIASGWASTSQLGSPEVKAKAESLLRTALSQTWSECESLAKDMSQDALKEVVEMAASAAVLNIVLKPLLRRLKDAPANPIVAEATSALQKIADKLGDEPGAKLDERNVVDWTEVTPEQAQLLLRALKLHQVDGHWLLETDRMALNLALSVARNG